MCYIIIYVQCIFFSQQAFGHNDISVLDGGFNKWLANQYETAEGEEQIKEVCQYYFSTLVSDICLDSESS